MTAKIVLDISTRIVAGLGSLGTIGDEVRRLSHTPRVALVADAGLSGSELLSTVIEALDGTPVVEQTPISPDPDDETVEGLARATQRSGSSVVVGVGGGSALTAARAAALLATNDVRAASLHGSDRAERPPLPCLAVPTTAGSGCEVSAAIVLRSDQRERHLLLRGRGYEPSTAILDGRTLAGLPERPFVHAALDALTHGFEAMWSLGATRVSDALAAGAVDTIIDRLPMALSERRLDDLQALIEASAMANLACGGAGLGLVHAFSASPLVDLPHGRQNGLLLPHVAAFNREVVTPPVAARIERIADLYEAIGFESSFESDDLEPPERLALFESGRDHPFRHTNLRPSAESDLRSILKAAGIAV